MVAGEQARIYAFGAFELDLGLQELRKDGRARAIEPQAFDLLQYLVEHRERLVTKDELNEQIWDGRFVTDAALSTYIKLARQAIGDSGQRQMLIRTVRGKGFRFVGAIDGDAPAGHLERGRRDHSYWLAAAATMLVMLFGAGIIYWVNLPLYRPSIAVLPFNSFSDDKNQEYFADGMTDDLITHLSKVKGLSVIARNSTFTYKGKSTKVQDIADDLGVRYVLEGSVRRAGDTIRINAQLTDGRTGDHLWAEIFDRQQNDIFSLQDEVIEKIVAALRVKLTADERRRLAEAPTDNPEAYELYLRARSIHLKYESRPDNNRKNPGLKEAIALYEEAINLDPTFAAAYAGIANVALYVWRSTLVWVMDSAEAQKLVRQSTVRALKFEPGNAAALDALSVLQFIEMAPAKAIATAEESVRLNPEQALAHVTLAHALAIQGRWTEGLVEADKAMALDPSPNTYAGAKLATVYFLGSRYETAIRLSADVAARAPNWYDGHWGLALNNAALGKLDEARRSADITRKLWAAINRRLSGVFLRHWHRDALDKWLSSMAKAGIPEWPYGFKDEPAKRLSGAEIRRLIIGRRMRAKAIYNLDVDIDLYPDGRLSYANDWAKTKGYWSLEGEKFCYHSPYVFNNRKYCSYFYRNETPTKEKPQPFIHISIWDRYYFSLEDIQRDR
ncbi:MAG: hypothetical protein HOA08_03700 [Rhodospirillaceae bacterium]|mgnify:FL=1|nr:hypothetical protein [Rhodospirillaceae bacterium]MBT3490991.1 hypothetical protein [Rhodospirillaceae bacterium]MBT3781742.1 hypothetical protein [Rhodospirillaceae bacterium]MBT3975222.1 hypothetical protein [Rhodospirillaceae bacterium]MBT4562038.1 hypothetical protein [Rhodospirillaceae bacterium]